MRRVVKLESPHNWWRGKVKTEYNGSQYQRVCTILDSLEDREVDSGIPEPSCSDLESYEKGGEK